MLPPENGMYQRLSGVGIWGVVSRRSRRPNCFWGLGGYEIFGLSPVSRKGKTSFSCNRDMGRRRYMTYWGIAP